MLTDITLGQYYPGHSYMHKLDPRTKIVGTLLYIVAVFLATNAVSYGLVTGFFLLMVLISALPLSMVLRSLKPLIFILVITFLLHAFLGEGRIVWSFHSLHVTEEGMVLGAKMSLRLALLLLVSSVLTFTTSPIVLTDGIEALLRPLKPLGVPAHELAMMMTIALRFIPTLLEETERIIKAQSARGADFASGNFLKKVQNLLPIVIPLFISSFRRADDLATAMEARCYRGGEGRTRMRELVFTWRDAVAFLGISALIIVMALMKWGKLCVI